MVDTKIFFFPRPYAVTSGLMIRYAEQRKRLRKDKRQLLLQMNNQYKNIQYTKLNLIKSSTSSPNKSINIKWIE